MIRAAAYARVSTDKEDQLNSLKNQKRFFEDYIRARPDWEFAGIFYDEGVTGTQAAKRAGFTNMIEKCRAGGIDLILTKEVSRFARNTVDALRYTRMLREYGVGVIFIGDGIDTRDNDGEFRLSIMASAAQEESRKISERVKWGQRRAMENGVVFGNNSIFGFTLKNGKLTINESEAETVRLIFHKYTDEHKGAYVIARELTELKILPPMRAEGGWSGSVITRILRNEKYVGDLSQRKYVTNDYLTHKKVLNHGEKILIKDHHEAVISREVWEKAQDEMKKRRSVSAGRGRHSGKYWCSGKIICGECGASFVARKSRKKSGVYLTWMCRSKMRGQCAARAVSNRSMLECMSFITRLIDIDLKTAANEIAAELNGGEPELAETKKKYRKAEQKKLKMLDSYYAGEISADEMSSLKSQYNSELTLLKNKLDEEKKLAALGKKSADDICEIISGQDVLSEYVYGELLDKITVYRDYITIRLKHLDFHVKLRYSTRGYKENYKTIIENYEIVYDEEQNRGGS